MGKVGGRGDILSDQSFRHQSGLGPHACVTPGAGSYPAVPVE